jgi:ribonuclease HI
MFSNIKLIGGLVGGVLVGALIGSLIMWGVQRVKVSDALREASNAKLEKANVVTALNSALEKVEKYKVALEDTLLVVKLLKQYQSIDNETKKEIESIREVYDGDNPSRESVERFKQLLIKINNDADQEIPSTGATTDGVENLLSTSNILEDKSDELFEQVMVIFFEETK